MFSNSDRPAFMGAPAAVFASAFAAVVIAAAAPSVAQAQAVDGRNVTEVAFAQGRFTLGQMGQWDERGNDGSAFRFTEQNRDDWSVYLFDASRDVRLQLDLHTRKIMYADASDPRMRPLYDVTGASAVVNGRNVSRVWQAQPHHHIGGNMGPRAQIARSTRIADESLTRKYARDGVFLDDSYLDILDEATFERINRNPDAIAICAMFGYEPLPFGSQAA